MARDRVQALMNLTYEKIYELEDLLNQESNLIGVDVSSQLSSIVLRQKEVVDRALRSIANVRQNSKNQPSTSRYGVTLSQSYNEKTAIAFNKGAITDGKEVTSHAISKSRSDNSHLRAILSSTSESKDEADNNGKDSSWYGSLDRNFQKRKKGPVYLDKSRRHRKTVASLAGLEQTDELQPDEQYEMGLPKLSASAIVNLSKLSLQPKRQTRTRVHENMIFPSPVPSLKAVPSASSFRHFNSTPSLCVLTSNSNFSGFHFLRGGDYNKMAFESSGNIGKTAKPKAWFETNLDESSQPSISPMTNSKMIQDSPTAEILETSSAKLTPPVLSPKTDSEKSSRSSESSESRLNFLNESTKPFEMSDYYKYSTKFRKLTEYAQAGPAYSAEGLNTPTRIVKAYNNCIRKDQQLGFSRTSEPQSSDTLDANGNRDNMFASISTSQNGKTTCTPDLRVAYLYQHLLPNAEVDPQDDDLAWVMDTPTFV